MSFLFDRALRERTVAHLVGAVQKVTMERQPFPHILVGGFLPDDVFRHALEHFPPPSAYHPFGYDKHHTTSGQSTRVRFDFTTACLGQLTGDLKTFWYTIRSALGSTELKTAVYEKLSPGLAFRYGIPREEARDLAGYAVPELLRETEGYSIKPHPDTRRKVVTMQLALARDASQEPLGTEFYRRSLNPLSLLREPRGFEIARRMPFLPNTAYAFSVLNSLVVKSWHGRTKIPGEFGERNSILNVWYESPEHGIPDLIEESRQLAPLSPGAARRSVAA